VTLGAQRSINVDALNRSAVGSVWRVSVSPIENAYFERALMLAR
jgi:hypothetical protein